MFYSLISLYIEMSTFLLVFSSMPTILSENKHSTLEFLLQTNSMLDMFLAMSQECFKA